ncbi:MAG TPA: hypothetical protein VKW04_07905 [Planctomycetota bacterium]|nr:hypothetical protein [Planctomycetota bacterium]
MRTSGVIGLFLLAACDQAPEATAIQRGESLFRPLADKLASSIASDLKKKDPGGFERYVKEAGGTSEAELILRISTETLAHYAEALSISKAKEKELRAGTFEDGMNQRKVASATQKLVASKAKLAHVCQVLLDKEKGGEWTTGLELEFVARILDSESRRSKD